MNSPEIDDTSDVEQALKILKFGLDGHQLGSGCVTHNIRGNGERRAVEQVTIVFLVDSIRGRASIKFFIEVFMGLEEKLKSACYADGTRGSAHCSGSL